MRHKLITFFAASSFFIVAAAGCGATPYTRAVGTYSKASGGSTDAIAVAPHTASSLCRTRAHMSYMQSHLQGDANSAISWNDFYTKVMATDTLSYEAYCKEMDKAGQLFGVAVAALTQYGSALGALAATGDYDGSELKSMTDSAAGIAASLGKSDAGDAIKPAGALLQTFGASLLAGYTESKLKGFVTGADETVQSLLDALAAYVNAVDSGLVKVVENAQRQTVLFAETRSGLIGQPADAAKLLQFYQFARATDDDVSKARAVIDGYRNVIQQMKSAHTELAKAGARTAPDDVTKVLGSIANLISQIQALESAIKE